MDPQILTMASIGIPVVAGLVEVAKRLGIPSRFAPIASLVFGFIFSALMLAEFSTVWALTGIITGLSASGLYSGAKAIARG